jgi:predicted nucleotidyltransferase
MIKNNIDTFIAKVSKLLKEQYKEFAGIYFFGSRVKGNYTSYSDYDLLFVFDRDINWKFEREIRHILYKYESEFEMLIDPKVVNLNQIKDPTSPFILNVKNEGIFYASQ